MPYELKGTLKLVECLGARTQDQHRGGKRGRDEADGEDAVRVWLCGAAPNTAGEPVEYLKRPDAKLGTAGEIENVPR